MSDELARLQVLLVEDEPEDLEQYERDFPDVFLASQIEVDIHPCASFDEAFALTSNPLYRFDLIVSDTYKGPAAKRDAQVIRMLNDYRGTRFCPLVVYSSGVKPADLEETPFIIWADKGKPGDIERAIKQLLGMNIPQLARKLQTELERATGPYLWDFLEKNWHKLNEPSPLDIGVLERMVRQRAAIQIGDLDTDAGLGGRQARHAPEYYIYPAFDNPHFNLGDVLRGKENQGDWRVILTPHCHLFVQAGRDRPRAEHVLLVKALGAETVLGDKLENAKRDEETKAKKLGHWSRSPAQTGMPPEGRHWYLPGFLDIPHSFCDFVQIESVAYGAVTEGYDRIATLTQPYAEALQSCFTGFYATVGIPGCQTVSITSMLD